MAADVKREVYDKGESVASLSAQELYTTQHQRSKPVLSGVGGQFLQMYAVAASLEERSGSELSHYYERTQRDPKDRTVKNAGELLLEENFVPFLLNYLNSANSHLTFIAGPKVDALVKGFGHGLQENGLHYKMDGLTREQYLLFRNAFIEGLNEEESWRVAKNPNVLEKMLNAVVLAMCYKVPMELQVGCELCARINLAPLMSKDKPLGAVLRVNETRAFNTHPAELDFSVAVINHKAESAHRAAFVNAICSRVDGCDANALKEAANERASHLEADLLALHKDVPVVDL